MALHGMAVLAQRPGQAVSMHQVAAELKASQAHLAKVFQRLARADLARSVRGPKGGFTLVRPAEEIRLLEIYQAIDGSLAKVNCLFGRNLCQDDSCIFAPILEKTHRLVSDHLANTTLSKLGTIYRNKIIAANKDRQN